MKLPARTAEQRVHDLEVGAEYENMAPGEYCEFSAIAMEAIALLRRCREEFDNLGSGTPTWLVRFLDGEEGK